MQQHFSDIIDEAIRQLLTKRMQLQDDTVTLDSLAAIKELGKGMFGNVYLVVHKDKRTLYALKCVSRKKIRAYDISTNVVLERKLLLQIDHVFIMKLVKTFKDQSRVYFLTEFVNGQDLFDVIRILGLVKNDDCRFYIGALILILEHLHERGIVYRDLKPENVMVDEMVLATQGYPKLIDFGTAKVVEGRTFTIVGTPHYMAPEVMLGKGYTQCVDVWSMGVMLYEFICGGVPFGEDEDDPFLIYEKILRDTLHFPGTMQKNSPVRGFLEVVLNKNPALRVVGGISKLKDHQWLYGFDWVRARQEKMGLKQLRAPFVPKLKDLKPEIDALIAQERSIRQVIDELESHSDDAETGEEHEEQPDWDRDF